MKYPLNIHVVIHDDLKDYDAHKLNTDYFSWLKTELEEISERSVIFKFINPGTHPDLSGYHYRNTDESIALRGWKQLVNKFHSKLTQSYYFNSALNPVLLLTRHSINSGVVGIAYNKNYAAISSIGMYRAPAHEIGHMLGATHKDSSIDYDGWWHNSIMLSDSFSQLRGNIYRFSTKNRENIRTHLSQFD